MKVISTSPNLNRTARLAGFFYLIVAITGFFSFYVREKLFVPGAASVTVNNINASLSFFNLGIVSELIMATSWILAAIILYRLFKTVNKYLALIMVSFVLVGGAIACINILNLIAIKLILNDSYYQTVFQINQLEALTMLFLNLSHNGVLINHIFFGLWLFPLGILVLKSDYFPVIIGKITGVLLIIAGVGYLADFLIFFLFHSHYSITGYTFYGELILLLWLLIRGVKTSLVKSSLSEAEFNKSILT